MPDMTIERLSLNLSGWSETDGRRLAQMITDGLAAAPVPDGAASRDAMQSKTTAPAPPAGGNMQELSDRIVADLVRQLGRSF